MSIAIEELQALGTMIPAEETARKHWRLECKVKNSGFDVDWGVEEDSRLLLGIWEHGMGAWDKIRDGDSVLKTKMFSEGDKKPLIKHVATRADYLLRALKKHHTLMKLKQPKLKKTKREPKTKKGKENAAASSSATGSTQNGTGRKGKTKGEKDGKGKDKEKGKRGKEKNKKDAKKNRPMHFAAQAEPTPVAYLGEMDPVIFNECKEKMRPVKKALKGLDNPDMNLPELDQIKATKSCLILIGQRITECLKTYTQEEERAKWKRYTK